LDSEHCQQAWNWYPETSVEAVLEEFASHVDRFATGCPLHAKAISSGLLIIDQPLSDCRWFADQSGRWQVPADVLIISFLPLAKVIVRF
jgi:hypothetical protein